MPVGVGLGRVTVGLAVCVPVGVGSGATTLTTTPLVVVDKPTESLATRYKIWLPMAGATQARLVFTGVCPIDVPLFHVL